MSSPAWETARRTQMMEGVQVKVLARPARQAAAAVGGILHGVRPAAVPVEVATRVMQWA